MPIENRSSSNHGTRTFTLDSLKAAIEQVQALHEISADLIAENIFSQPAQHDQGGPIMLTAVATLEEDGDGGLEPNWLLEGGTAELLAGMTLLVADNAPHLCDDDGSAQVYTHADPAEVERLRAVIAMEREGKGKALLAWQQAGNERDALRAQLAEAQALLREVGDSGFMADGQIMPSHEAVELQERVEAFVSASAEPSAPSDCAICRDLGNQCMECEEGEFREWADRHFAAADYRKTDAGVFIQDWMRHAYGAWCARGALGRKP